MRKLDSLTGQRVGTLTITGPAPARDRKRWWFAICTLCSRTAAYRQDRLTGANRASCECQDGRITHGATRRDGRDPDPLYVLWQNVKARVRRQPYGYKLDLQPEWKHFPTFRRDILAECGPRPSKAHSLDRINVMAGYIRNNIRWADHKEQANNRTSNRLYPSREYGAALTASEWAQYIRQLTGDTARWTRERVEKLLAILTPEELIAGVHPHRPTLQELNRASRRDEEKLVLEEMDREVPDGLTLTRRIAIQDDRADAVEELFS